MQKQQLRTRLLAEAFVSAEVEAFMKAWYHVMEQAPEQLLPVVNTLLHRMWKDRSDLHVASFALMADLETLTGKQFVMAAAVDIAIHNRKAGSRVKSIEPLKEILERIDLPAKEKPTRKWFQWAGR